ncbi:MAG: hypothetical protein ACFFEV_04815, partial [Candidatus Thorarchaeota archaeon]
MVGENEQKHELYGVSPRVIAFVMIFFSLIVAIGILPMSVFLVCMIVEGGIDPIFLDDYLWFAFN